MQIDKRYGVIIADPPWLYRNGGNGAADAHYPTMSIDRLCSLPVSQFAAENSVLLLWTTWPQLSDAICKLVPAWGFEYVTGFPWVKVYDPPMCDLFGDFVAFPTWGTGAWVRGCSEPILICRRGNAKAPEVSWLGIISERMMHSRKPESLHEYAETLPGPYLELFARRKRLGWDAWGDEVQSDISIFTPEATNHA